MKLNWISIFHAFVISMILFTSCEKENIDTTTSNEDDVTTEVVLCALEATIETDTFGMLSAIVTEGTAPYIYNWSTGETTNSISSNTAGTYTVEVTDSEGCVGEASIDIGNTTPCDSFYVTINMDTTGNILTADVILGGNAPYAYLWPTGETTRSIMTNGAGVYSVEVTDSEGCIYQMSHTVGGNPCNSFSITIEEDLVNSLLNGVVVGGTAPYA